MSEFPFCEEVLCIDNTYNDSCHLRFTKGKIYKVWFPEESDTGFVYVFYIKDDNANYCSIYPEMFEYFSSLSDYRESQINKLL